jgi:RNA polymerase sigma-70 factor, ECF subfamily
MAATVMRRVLVDHARTRVAGKRSGDQVRVEVEHLLAAKSLTSETVLALSEALDRLKELDPRQCLVVEMRFFGGLTDEEIAAVPSVSARTIKRDWAAAKAWLYSHLS